MAVECHSIYLHIEYFSLIDGLDCQLKFGFELVNSLDMLAKSWRIIKSPKFIFQFSFFCKVAEQCYTGVQRGGNQLL
jgi:hypothetical protein